MKVIRIWRELYIHSRFFYLLGGLSLLFGVSFATDALFVPAQILFLVFVSTLLADGILLFSRNLDIDARRQVPRLFNLGDKNPVHLDLRNNGSQPMYLRIIDELPIKLQRRDFEVRLRLAPNTDKRITYQIRPTQRGAYHFGALRVFAASPLRLLERRLSFHEEPVEVPVYPSILQMKQMAFKAFDRLSTQKGIKKIRRIGHSYEFEQIKNYVRGDDYRSINWKASSRRHTLMVNQYEDERAQQIYCVIDKSRSMRLPFHGLSLMDYAINTSLVMSNIALQKYDKAGLITFSDKLGTTLKADSTSGQLNKILTALYNERERPLEANFELLYYASRKLVSGRSLFLLFTNFESAFALDRVLPILRRINKLHLLVVIIFENTEIREFADRRPEDLAGIYQQVTARQFLSEKQQMVEKLQQYGIQAILTAPEDLSVNAINKYLELKARGLI
jgi:uncharacterized protein (DUF58 family)